MSGIHHAISSNAKFWHGTGRYKYDGDKVVDILSEIISAGGLKPYDDEWDQKRGKIQTVSTAYARDYARLYASLFFPPPKRTLRELWNRFGWSCFYFLSSKWVAWGEYLPPKPHILDLKRKLVAWTKKLSSKPQSFTVVFLWGGTDIPINYPVLIGVKEGAVIPTSGSRFVDLHEARSTSLIPLADFTHIEVPMEHVDETRLLLERNNISVPVIPL